MNTKTLVQKVYVKENSMGRGVYAGEDLKKGEIVCFYPVDISYTSDGISTIESLGNFSHSFIKKMCADLDMTPRQIETFTVTEEVNLYCVEQIRRLSRYGQSVDGNRGSRFQSIMAMPENSDWPFISHLINDPLNENEVKKITKMRVKKASDRMKIAKIYNIADKRRNCEGIVIGLNYFTVISKDIKEGEELRISYGATYWRNKNAETLKYGKMECNSSKSEFNDFDYNMIMIKGSQIAQRLEKAGFDIKQTEKIYTHTWIKGIDQIAKMEDGNYIKIFEKYCKTGKTGILWGNNYSCQDYGEDFEEKLKEGMEQMKLQQLIM